jgi:hypothetical protein
MQEIKHTHTTKDGELNIELNWNGHVVFINVSDLSMNIHSSGLLKAVNVSAVNRIILAQEL